jgi:hypothetical protein
MKKLLSMRRHQYLAMASTFLIILAFIAGIVGCDGGGGETYELTISSTSGGSVTDPGEGVYTYDEGTVVPLVAGAYGDYQFVSWTGDVGTITDISDATTNITMNGDYSITAEFAYIPVSVPSEWNRVSSPTLEGFVMAPESTIIDYALASDGEAAYAVVYAGDEEGGEPYYRLLKSEDHAATWDDITHALEDVDDAYTIGEMVRVATDWEGPDFVAVAVWEDGELRVYFSTDGGDAFEDAGEVYDGGVYFDDPDDVSDLAISYEAAGKREIAIGGMANDNSSALFRCTVTGDTTSAWEDAAAYDGWDDNGSFNSTLVTDIIFSLSWTNDKTILVTSVATGATYYNVYLQCGSWGTSAGWNEYSTLGIEAVLILEDEELPLWLSSMDARGIAGIALPEDYNSKNSDERILWVWVNYYDYIANPACVIMRVDDDSADPVGPMGQIEDGQLWLTNISYHGTIAEGEAIAGVLGNGMGDWTECCEGVQVYRNDGIRNMDICCERWHDACKPPTGMDAMAVSYVGDDKAYAVALQGEPCFDEGAWSVTFDDGDTWNQLSLIDTYIDYFSDVAVSPDCNKTFLVSAHEDYWEYNVMLPVLPPWVCYVIEYDHGGGYYDIRYPECDSVWLHAENLPEAEEYSGQWLRTWCGILEGDWGMLRLAPEETTGDTVFLIDYDADNVYRLYREIYDVDCWDSIGSTELDYIVDLAAQDADTFFALDYYGDVAMFDGDEWQEAVDSKVNYGHTIAIWGDHILVGGEDGDVSYSNDGGQTFDLFEETPTIGGYVTVAFDTYFDTNSVVYAATDEGDYTGGTYRWVIGESDELTNLHAEPLESQIGIDDGDAEDEIVEVACTGIVVDRLSNPFTDANNGGVIYASYIGYWNGSYFTGVARSLEREVTEYMTCIGWDFLQEGLTVDVEGFDVWPHALKICGCLTQDSNSKLFSINHWDYYDMVDYETGSIWTFEDCYAKRAPHLTSPADGETITANPSTCFNVPFALYWNQLCDAYLYDIELALDEDFTLILGNYQVFAVDPCSYLVAGGELSCEVTYYWRIRAAEDGTGQAIHSWWSEPRSFTVTDEG